jgi:hypothetical protein
MEEREINLKDGLSQLGMCDLEKLRNNLFAWTKEWLKAFGSAEGVTGRKSIIDYFRNRMIITIHLKETISPFQAELYYRMEGNQVVLNINVFQKNKRIFEDLNYDDGEVFSVFKDFEAQWEDEDIYEFEIREKGYTLELLNKRFFNYLNSALIKY